MKLWGGFNVEFKSKAHLGVFWTPSFLGPKGVFTLGSKSTKEIPKSSIIIARKHKYGHKESTLGTEAKETPK